MKDPNPCIEHSLLWIIISEFVILKYDLLLIQNTLIANMRLGFSVMGTLDLADNIKVMILQIETVLP